jgi:hypothetical protein
MAVHAAAVVAEERLGHEGGGLAVAFLATFFTTYLNHIRLSAIFVSVANLMPISHCPAVATSWWPTSTSMPLSIKRGHHVGARSTSVSFGATGK